MGERDSSTQNFKAVGKNNKVEREKLRLGQRKRQILIIILTLVIIILCIFAIVIFRQVFAGIPASMPKDDETSDSPGTAAPPDSEVRYVAALRALSDIHKGNLILINQNFNYVFPSASPAVLPLYSNRNQVESVKTPGKMVYSYYTQSADTSAALTSETLDALNRMADDFYKLTGNNDLFIYDN